IIFGFRYDAKPNGQRAAAGMIQARDEIDAFHTPIVAVVVMPADYLVLVSVWLFGNTIIDDKHPVVLLNLPHIRLHNLPQVGSTKFSLRQQALDLIMAYLALQQPGQ